MILTQYLNNIFKEFIVSDSFISYEIVNHYKKPPTLYLKIHTIQLKTDILEHYHPYGLINYIMEILVFIFKDNYNLESIEVTFHFNGAYPTVTKNLGDFAEWQTK